MAQNLSIPVDDEVETAASAAGVPLSWKSRSAYVRYCKPLIDFLGALLLLVLASPVIAMVALLVRCTMGPPVLFKQQRVGRNGRIFTIYKFRSMLPDRRVASRPHAGPDRRVRHKSIHDPRMTRVGRFIREWSLDELPQLFNIVAGHMSLVGPRPELVEIVERYEPWQHPRHEVKPGLTGLWQVSARGDGLMHDHVEVDLSYLERVSFFIDCKLLLSTIPVVLGQRRGQ